MTVDMQAEFVRFIAAGFEPLRVERPVELHSGEAFLFRLVDPCDRVGLASGNVGNLSGVGALAVDQ